MTSRTIRLMSWNIHRGIGPDRRFDLDRIAAVIRRHAPDILALQEIDTRGRDPACLVPLKGILTPDGHFAEARTKIAPDGHYGHALFSRWPMTGTLVHDLTVWRREPRSVIEATIETQHGALHIVAVHLGLEITERHRQARKLARLAREPKGMATVMLGDFNDWFSFGQVRRTLAAVLPERTSLKTFPAARPTLKLDRIYSSTRGSIRRSWTDHEARACSDHLPLMAELTFGPSERLLDGHARAEDDYPANDRRSA
ncbi:MAG: Endonuclease/exonuclease/phosphatase [Xanthobacteraceae bacterium]|nr:Endonuclease/exonuclease/phosphatase [Xanthobacteraceae bacterium]